MKEKCFQLLKEQWLLQSAGGLAIFDKTISLTVDIYCELVNINREEFIAKWCDIWTAAWNEYGGDLKSWRGRQDLYSRLIDTLEVK